MLTISINLSPFHGSYLLSAAAITAGLHRRLIAVAATRLRSESNSCPQLFSVDLLSMIFSIELSDQFRRAFTGAGHGEPTSSDSIRSALGTANAVTAISRRCKPAVTRGTIADRSRETATEVYPEFSLAPNSWGQLFDTETATEPIHKTNRV